MTRARGVLFGAVSTGALPGWGGYDPPALVPSVELVVTAWSGEFANLRELLPKIFDFSNPELERIVF